MAERLDEVAMVVAHNRRVLQPERHHVVDEIVDVLADHGDDRVLGLEVDQRLIAVGVADAMHLGHRLSELLDDFRELVGFGELAPVQIGVVGRDFAHHEADPVDVGVTEQGVGVCLQRPLGHGRAVPMMLEVFPHLAVVDDAAGRGDVALFIDSTASLSNA